MDDDSNWVTRRLAGFRALCATIDMLGIRALISRDVKEAYHRINDLYVIGSIQLLHPDAEENRAAFLGDSLLVVREIPPGVSLQGIWPSFCARAYAVASKLQGFDRAISQAGLRAVVSYGDLVQLEDPDGFTQALSGFTKKYWALTGVCEALAKCTEVERVGRRGGFSGNYCWHENLDNPAEYLGTPFKPVSHDDILDNKFAADMYDDMCARREKTASLKFDSWNVWENAET